MSRYRWTPKLLALIVTGWLSLTACVDAEQRDFEYVERLAYALGGVYEAEGFPPLVRYPTRRALTLAVVDERINLLEFADLHRCDLGALVGERNSPQNRLAGAAQRFEYEREFLRRAQGCESEAVQAVLEQKRTALNLHAWNAIFAGHEMQLAMGFAQPQTAVPDMEVMAALLALVNDVDDTSAPEIDVTALLQRLSVSSIGNRRAEWQLWRQNLTLARQLLARRTVCLSGEPTPKARHAVAVFRRYYVQGLQVEAAAKLAEDRRWLAALAKTLDSLHVAPSEFVNFYERVFAGVPGSEWSRTEAAFTAHAKAWDTFLAECGLSVRDIAEDTD